MRGSAGAAAPLVTSVASCSPACMSTPPLQLGGPPQWGLLAALYPSTLHASHYLPLCLNISVCTRLPPGWPRHSPASLHACVTVAPCPCTRFPQPRSALQPCRCPATCKPHAAAHDRPRGQQTHTWRANAKPGGRSPLRRGPAGWPTWSSALASPGGPLRRAQPPRDGAERRAQHTFSRPRKGPPVLACAELLGAWQRSSDCYHGSPNCWRSADRAAGRGGVCLCRGLFRRGPEPAGRRPIGCGPAASPGDLQR